MDKKVSERLQQAAEEKAIYLEETIGTSPHSREAIADCLIEMAVWQRNSIWHDTTELPNDGKRIVVVGSDDVVFSCTYVGDGNYRAFWGLYDLRKQKKWCYVDELLPVMG